jgi:hypothetical protein
VAMRVGNPGKCGSPAARNQHPTHTAELTGRDLLFDRESFVGKAWADLRTALSVCTLLRETGGIERFAPRFVGPSPDTDSYAWRSRMRHDSSLPSLD